MNIRKKIDYSQMYAAIDDVMAQNLPQMQLYCSIGKIVCTRSEKGAAVMASEYLIANYPDVKGFSPRSLRRMRDFYRTYENHPDLMSCAMQLGWIHNVVIMEADLTIELREWYMRATKQFGWSKTELISKIENRAHVETVLDIGQNMCYIVYNDSSAAEDRKNGGDTMSRKSRERRSRNKGSYVIPDDYYSDGQFELARFGKNTVLKKNVTREQHNEIMEGLCHEYPIRYESISLKVSLLKNKIVQCNPLEVLTYLKNIADMAQMNIFSSFLDGKEMDALIRALEYVQSVIVSTKNEFVSIDNGVSVEALLAEIIEEFNELYKEIVMFYPYWSAKIQRERIVDDDTLINMVEAQCMYWVRGNRYQVFELEPLRKLLPPHDIILKEIFGVSAEEVVQGLEKLQYSLSQARADAFMDFGQVYDAFCKAIDSGISEEDACKKAGERTPFIADKMFGTTLNDVSGITGWDQRFIDALSLEVGENKDFFSESEFSGWPIVELPVMRKPFIKIEGKSYAFLYYLLFDNIYRNIQRIIFESRKDYSNVWKDKQCEASEVMVKDIFLKLLPGAKSYVGNYYPVKNSLKQMNENDIIIIYNNYLFVVEVKAGSFPISPPISDFNAHVNAYKKLVQAADSQCSRTLDYISSHSPAVFYDCNKQEKFEINNLASFDDIFTFSVTVENFNEFAAKAEKLKFLSLARDTIVISCDDLLVYANYFDSPIVFLHYLQQRKAQMKVSKYQMFDELDHLGLYINRNCYALHPEQYGDADQILWDGFREELDAYYNMLYHDSSVKKPTQSFPRIMAEILSYIDGDVSIEGIRLAHYLLNMSSKSREEFGQQVSYLQQRQKQIHKMVPAIAFGEIKHCIFVEIPGVEPMTAKEQREYVYAAASRNETIPVMWINLQYDEKQNLVSAKSVRCIFDDLDVQEQVQMREYGCRKAKDWVITAIRSHGKVGRNEMCPCGSGKKYKFCCYNAE